MIKNAARNLKHYLFLQKKSYENTREARKVYNRANFSTHYKNLENTFNFPNIPKVRGIWGIAMVKNEVDIISHTIHHLFEQGVDHVLIADNGSTDGTYELLHSLSKSLPITVGIDKEPAYYQSEKMTWLAHAAIHAGAQWIIPFDADEFWYGIGGNLREVLANLKNPIQLARFHNIFPSPDGKYNLDTQPHWDSKVAFKAWKNSVISMGNHDVLRPGIKEENNIGILHLPWRSKEQLRAKIINGAKALKLTDLPEDKGFHWRNNASLSEQELDNLWLSLIMGKEISYNISWKPHGQLKTIDRIPDSYSTIITTINTDS